MTDDGAYLRLSKREAVAALIWFLFQEMSDIELGAKYSTILSKDRNFAAVLSNKITELKSGINKSKSIKLNVEQCKILDRWFYNLPRSLIDQIDIDVHYSIELFLDRIS